MATLDDRFEKKSVTWKRELKKKKRKKEKSGAPELLASGCPRGKDSRGELSRVRMSITAKGK